MTMTFAITETKKRPGPLNENGGGWVEGYIGDYTFQAKVYACGSKFGINDGTISKLWICHTATRKVVVNYDRGWDIEPANEHIQEMVDALVERYYAE